MADPYNFSFDVAAFLEEQEAADTSVAPKEGVMKKPEAPVEEAPMPITEKLKKRLADTVQGFYNSTQEIRDRYNKAQETNPLLGRDAAQSEWMKALSAPAVTAAELNLTMDTLAMQDAQEQAAIRSASGITESLGRPAPAGLGNAPAQPETPVIYEAAATVTNGADSVVDRTTPAGLMTRPVQETVSEVDTSEPVAKYTETTDVEGLEGPESISSSIVQSLKKQTDTVSRGDKGNTVRNAQLRLAELGYEIGRGGTSGLSKNKRGKWVSLDNSQLRGVDSDFGPSTQSAVKDFQEDAGLPITGEIDAATATALATKEPVAFRVPENLTKNFSTTQTSNFNAAKDAAEKEGLKGAELASFMSQVAHESDSFRTAKEYASGSAYEGRSDLGNTQAGDGVRYKGRGYIQLTGRSNYEKAGKALGLDLLNNPSLAEEPKNAAAVSLWFWKTSVKPQVPDFMDTERVTKVVNGGFNGLKDRKKYFEKFTKKWSDDR
jgi:predicted chitinase